MSTEKKLSSFATLNHARRTNTPGVGYWYLFMKFAEGGKQPPMLVYSNTTITHYELLYKPNMLSQGMTQLCHTIIISRCLLCKIISGQFAMKLGILQCLWLTDTVFKTNEKKGNI